MVTICVGDGFDVDIDGRLVHDLRPGCNAMSVAADGVGVMGVDKFDEVERFGDDDYAEDIASTLGPFTSAISTTFVGLDNAVDTTIVNPSACRPMMWMAFGGHFINWYSGDEAPGRFVVADLTYINDSLLSVPAGEHSLSWGITASLSTHYIVGPFLLAPEGTVKVSTQPAWRAQGEIAAATVADLTWSIRTVGWFV